jgi:hypothetical protein
MDVAAPHNWRRNMINKLALIALTAAATCVLAANTTYKVSLLQNSIVDGKQLKAGDYKIEINGSTATLKQGKKAIEVPAREETSSNKFAVTEIQFDNKNDLQEIHVGGTTTTIIFTQNQTPGVGE